MPGFIHLPDRLCTDPASAIAREWLVTNGIGGFAAGTVAGALTRRYHGLLLAALQPPVGRRLLVAKLDETAHIAGREYPLYANIWRSGLEEPAGLRRLWRFDLVRGVPTWTFDLDGVLLVKRIWMEPGANITYVQYEAPAASADAAGADARAPRSLGNAAPVLLTCRLLVNDRDYHTLASAGREFHVRGAGPDLEVRAAGAAVSTRVRCVCAADPAEWKSEQVWYHGFHLPVEAERGFDAYEDHLSSGACRVRLEPGDTATFILMAGDGEFPAAGMALSRRNEHAEARLATWADCSRDAPAAAGRMPAVLATSAPTPVAQLVLAADQFIVARPSQREPDGHTIIAGYPWFTDWGRDTMIALPGLTLVTGRPELARQILRTWAGHVTDGLIPNRFPDAGDRPDYNTADATLWYLWAIDQYVRVTGDLDTLADLFPVMLGIIDAHRRGTRHDLHVDTDGLVYAGGPGLNLTWMDAKIGDHVITPRTGKPVELSALWYDAIRNMARLAALLGHPGQEYADLAEVTRASFERFWNPARGCLFDVLDGPDGPDARLRPNQIFAVALEHSPLPPDRQRAIVDACQRELLTWYGLRTLAPGEPGYHARYAGGPVERDEAYHQGTAWTWLLGPFTIAHWRVHRDAAAARALLAPLFGQLWTAGLGTLSEVCDADEPYRPGGCFAQAWSVAEALRAWHVTQVEGPVMG
ncbi:MAG: amylo-alpha-1,6-glucosidase [Planctomycetota bacterium]